MRKTGADLIRKQLGLYIKSLKEGMNIYPNNTVDFYVTFYGGQSVWEMYVVSEASWNFQLLYIKKHSQEINIHYFHGYSCTTNISS